ncbi:EF-hand domain-containing protein [Thiolapillus sp.]
MINICCHSRILVLVLPLVFPTASIQADEGGVYSAYDSNSDGYLDKAEFEVFLKKRRIRKPYRHLWVFEMVDRDGDQRISNQELVDTLQKEMTLRNRKTQ